MLRVLLIPTNAYNGVSRGKQRDGAVHLGQHTYAVRMNNVVDTVGGFRGQTGVGMNLQYV